MRKYMLVSIFVSLILVSIAIMRIINMVNVMPYYETVSEHERIIQLSNVWISEVTEKGVTVFCEGIKTEFDTKLEITAGTVADIVLSNKEIVNISYKTDRRNETIIAVRDDGIELSSGVNASFDEECRIYSVYDELKQISKDDLSVGYAVTDVVYDNENVCAILVTGKVNPDRIRVALMTSGYKSHFHQNVEIASDAGMKLVAGGKEYPYVAGEVAGFGLDNFLLKEGRVTVVPDNGGRLLVKNILRNNENRYYRGQIELALTSEGIVMINDLTIDEYLYAVVPSEMPVSYGMEALKAQAVCARSYAYMQILSGKLANIGAHVDDSTSYQVYNNSSECEQSIQAVNETTGRTLTYNGEVISAYYFSTSCGHTASGNDVWLGMKKVDYLSGGLQNDTNTDTTYDLTNEKTFKDFIDNKPISTYDSSFPWYRWNVTLQGSQIKESFEKRVAARVKANPSLILVKEKGMRYKASTPKDIGDIQSIKVSKRAPGGIVTELVIKGSKASVKIKSEYNIRLLLAPHESVIHRNDGSVVNGLSLMPSAFLYIKKDGDSYTFYGGGYGHGVGMSQNGASKMAEAGATYIDILTHYYKGCEVS